MIRSGGVGSGGLASSIIGDNLLQNGDMLIDQRFAGASVTVSTGTTPLGVDRWSGSFLTSTSGAGDPTMQQQAASSGIVGFVKSIIVTSNATPSTTNPTTLRFELQQRIEGSDIEDLAFGTASPKTITVSGWIKTSLTNATFGVALLNSANNRSYVTAQTIPTAATWTYFSFTTVGDATGTWLNTPGTIGLRVVLTLTRGPGGYGTANTWQAGGLDTTSAQTNFTDTAGATVETTGWKVERGSVATSFVADPTAVAITKLQRYYRKSFPIATAPAQSAGVAGAVVVNNPIALGQPGTYVAFNPAMYASPTIVTYNPSAGNANWRDVTAAADVAVSVDPATAKSTTGVNIATGGTVTNIADTLAIHYSADAGI